MAGEQLRKCMKELEGEMQKLFINKDFKGMAAHYTDDCKMYLQGMNKPFCGRNGVMEAIGMFHNHGVAKMDLKQDELICGGDNQAVMIGHFTCSDSHGAKLADGKFQTYLKKIGNRWFIHREMTNMNEFEIHGQLRERFYEWNEMNQKGDHNALVEEFYTDDCKIAIAGRPPACGKTAIKALMKERFAAMPSMCGGRFNTHQGEVYKLSDDLAVECDSKFAFHDNKGHLSEKGRYMIVWKKAGGKWRIHTDFVNPMTECGQEDCAPHQCDHHH
jgi:ketosteroid isomerase-like protein